MSYMKEFKSQKAHSDQPSNLYIFSFTLILYHKPFRTLLLWLWLYQILSLSLISPNPTRNIINAIHDGKINDSNMETLPIFNLQYPTKIDGVDSNILNPANSWKNKDEFKESLHKVAEMFNENFKKYETIASSTVKAGAPKL